MLPELDTTFLSLSETLAHQTKELQSCAKVIRALAFPNAGSSFQPIHSTIPAPVLPTRKRKAKDDYEPAQTNKDKAKPRLKAYTDATSAVSVTQTSPIKKLDPCARFPTEIWHHVLSFLPVSQIATVSLVCMAWLHGCRALPLWKRICLKSQYGEPKRKYRSHMAIVCAWSFFICDGCYINSEGKRPKRLSEIPLPVQVERKRLYTSLDDSVIPAADQTETRETIGKVTDRWLLCRDCRRHYYKEHPEPLRSADDVHYSVPGEQDRICYTNARSKYALLMSDLYGLRYQRGHSSNVVGILRREYDLKDVQKIALNVHGGWVGVQAAAGGLRKKRQAAFKARWRAARDSAVAVLVDKKKEM